MAIWLDSNSKILVQGMTGSEGTKHTRRMVASGASVVAGVTPGKEGQDVDGIPIYNDVAAAMAQTGANVSVVFVPPRFAKGAVEEAVENLRDALLFTVECMAEEGQALPPSDVRRRVMREVELAV